jgi:DNA replication protein DnaC
MIMGQYRRAPLLILDDVGVGHVRQESLPWLHDIYWRLFDRRAELRLPALVTTNLSLDELPGRLGQRGFSRLLGMMGGPDNFIDLFSVPDYRARGWK